MHRHAAYGLGNVPCTISTPNEESHESTRRHCRIGYRRGERCSRSICAGSSGLSSPFPGHSLVGGVGHQLWLDGDISINCTHVVDSRAALAASSDAMDTRRMGSHCAWLLDSTLARVANQHIPRKRSGGWHRCPRARAIEVCFETSMLLTRRRRKSHRGRRADLDGTMRKLRCPLPHSPVRGVPDGRGRGAASSVPDDPGSDTQAQTGQGGVGMRNVLPDLGPDIVTSGNSPRGDGESVVRIISNMPTDAEHELCSRRWCPESRSNWGDCAVDSS